MVNENSFNNWAEGIVIEKQVVFQNYTLLKTKEK